MKPVKTQSAPIRTAAAVLLAGLALAPLRSATAQDIYPVGFVWNRYADWTVRPASDANTTNGNPDDDQSGRPVWKYEAWQNSNGGIGSPQPWYIENNISPFALRWNPNWFGSGVSCWSVSTNIGPGIARGDPTLDFGLLHLLPPGQTVYGNPTAVKLIYPGSCVLRAQLTGQLLVVWSGNSPGTNTAPIDVALVIRRAASGVTEPVLLQRVNRPAGTDRATLPVDFEVTLAPGDALTVTHRGTASDPNNWNALYDMLTMTALANGTALMQQPASLLTCWGGTATFTVSTGVPGEHQFQWSRGGAALADGPTGSGAMISGATTSTLTISGARPADAGAHDCFVTNACGSVTSDAAILTICDLAADLNCDLSVNLSDLTVLLAHFGTPGGATHADGDLNGDSDVDLSDLTQFLAGFGTTCL